MSWAVTRYSSSSARLTSTRLISARLISARLISARLLILMDSLTSPI